MPHCDPAALDEAAIGTHTLSEVDQRHVEQCEECAETLAALSHVVAVARTTDGLQLVSPPDSVWLGITSEIGESTTAGSSVVVEDHRPELRHRWPRWAPLAIAAVLGVVVGGAIAGVIATRDPAVLAPQVVASATLAPLPENPVDTQAAGTAVLKNVDGEDVLVLDTRGLPEPVGFYEVWLMDPKTAGLISIGSVPGGVQQTSLTVPSGVSFDEFSVVDISVEPLDGNPTHSAVSVLRGQLTI